MRADGDIAGRRYGRLPVINFSHAERQGDDRHHRWRCRCDCGVEKILKTSRFTRVRSCGSLRNETSSKRAHALSATPEYRAWRAMLARRHEPSHPKYQTYGARGITVRDRRRASFEVFLSDVGPRPAPNRSLDRIDNNRNYEPSNIRWTTKLMRQKNRCPSSEWRRTA